VSLRLPVRMIERMVELVEAPSKVRRSATFVTFR
jgi:hypothetical protein